jgi:hypothetical protein
MHATETISNMPGFTAEASLSETSERYRAATDHIPSTAGVTPAAPCCYVCDDYCASNPTSSWCYNCKKNCISCPYPY